MFSSDDEPASSLRHSSKSIVPCFSDSLKSADPCFSESMCCSRDKTKDCHSNNCELESDEDGFSSSAGGFKLGSDAVCDTKPNDEVVSSLASDDKHGFESSEAASRFTLADTGDDFNSHDTSSDFASDDAGSDFASDDGGSEFASDEAKDFASDGSEDVESLADEFASLFGSVADDNDRPVDVEVLKEEVSQAAKQSVKPTSTAWQLSGSISDSIVRIFLNNPNEEVRKHALAITGAQNCEQLHVLVSNRLHELLKRAHHRRGRKQISNDTAQMKQEMPTFQHPVTEANE